MKKGKTEKAILEIQHPDIVERLNEKARVDKEKNRRKKEKEDKHSQMIEREAQLCRELREELNWAEDVTVRLTAEEEKSLKLQEQEQYEECAESKRKEIREKRKEKHESVKATLLVPLPAFPEQDLSPYEQLRETNIKEREAAMLKVNFFEDLSKCKEDIGLKKVKKDEIESKDNSRVSKSKNSKK